MRMLALASLYPLSADHAAGQFNHVTFRELRGQGHEIEVVCGQCHYPSLFTPRHWRRQGRPQAPDAYVLEGVPVQCPRFWRPPGRWWRAYIGRWQYRAFRRQIAARHAQHPFDIAYGCQLLPDGMTALLLGRELNIPVMVGSIGSDTHTYPYEMRETYRATQWVLNNADAVIVEGAGDAVDAVRRLGATSDAIRVFNRGIDLGRFGAEADVARIRRENGLPVDRRLATFVGNLIEGKGVRVLLKAFGQLQQDFADVDLVIIGDGPLRGTIDNLTTNTGLGDRVHMLGRRSFQEVPELLSACDVFCLPSFAEGLPKAVIEAMAAGLPVVTTRVGALEKVIDHGITGLLVPPRDEAALAAALGTLLRAPDEARQMGKAARAVARERYDARNNATELVRLAEEVLARLHRPARAGDRQTTDQDD